MANSVVPEEAAAWILYLLSTLWSKRLLSTLHQVLLVATTLSGTDKTFLTDVLLTVNLGEAYSKQIKQKPTVCQPFRTEVGHEKKWGCMHLRGSPWASRGREFQQPAGAWTRAQGQELSPVLAAGRLCSSSCGMSKAAGLGGRMGNGTFISVPPSSV